MAEEAVYAVDLMQQIGARGWTQTYFASLFPESGTDHVKKIARGYRPITLSFAIECLEKLGTDAITVRKGDEEYVIARKTALKGGPDPDRIPDDEELHDLTDAEHNLNVMQQAEDVVRAMQRLVASPLLLRSDTELSEALRIAKYKELFELDWAVRGRLREGQELHPHLVEEGLRRALAERPGYPQEVSGIEPAA